MSGVARSVVTTHSAVTITNGNTNTSAEFGLPDDASQGWGRVMMTYTSGNAGGTFDIANVPSPTTGNEATAGYANDYSRPVLASTETGVWVKDIPLSRFNKLAAKNSATTGSLSGVTIKVEIFVES